jgi:hypothetical protein
MTSYEETCAIVVDKQIFSLYSSMEQTYLVICANTIAVAYNKRTIDVYSDLIKLLKEQKNAKM